MVDLVNPTRFASLIAETIQEFTLIDIGCAGRIDPAFEIFGNKLRAYGFDSNVEDLTRLAAKETRPNVKYVPGLIVGSGEYGEPDRNPWGRLAVYKTLKITERQRLEAKTEDKTYANDWHFAPRATENVFLPDYFRSEKVDSIDFLKIDIDGPDFDVLQSLRNTLSSCQVLGVRMEVNWIGSEDPKVHTFHNTDRFMRECGFDLFDFNKRTYSVADLPSRYLYSFPAESTQGRPVQGDAVYIRDLASPDQAKIAMNYSNEKLFRLAAVFSMAGQPDSAAEVLNCFHDRLSGAFNIPRALDILAADSEISGQVGGSYSDLIAAFEQNDGRFYTS